MPESDDARSTTPEREDVSGFDKTRSVTIARSTLSEYDDLWSTRLERDDVRFDKTRNVTIVRYTLPERDDVIVIKPRT